MKFHCYTSFLFVKFAWSVCFAACHFFGINDKRLYLFSEIGLVNRLVKQYLIYPLKLWQEMGSPVQLTPAEVESLKTRSAVTDEPLDASYADGVLSAEVELGVNDVAFIRIKE